MNKYIKYIKPLQFTNKYLYLLFYSEKRNKNYIKSKLLSLKYNTKDKEYIEELKKSVYHGVNKFFTKTGKWKNNKEIKYEKYGKLIYDIHSKY